MFQICKETSQVYQNPKVSSSLDFAPDAIFHEA
jgi:hypothetical protein